MTSTQNDSAHLVLSIVVPAYNEAQRVESTLLALLDHARSIESGPDGGGVEILLVDDGSTDRTVEIARKLLTGSGRHRVLNNPDNRGKGFAVRSGMLAARGQRILFTDADLSAPIEDIVKLHKALDEGANVAIASRAVKGAEFGRRQSRIREWLGRGFNLVVQALVLPGIWDTQCGFKLFSRNCAHEVFERAKVDGYAFDVEALYLAQRLGYEIAEVPVAWSHSPDTRVRVGRDGLSMVRQVLRIRCLHRQVARQSMRRSTLPEASRQTVE